MFLHNAVFILKKNFCPCFRIKFLLRPAADKAAAALFCRLCRLFLGKILVIFAAVQQNRLAPGKVPAIVRGRLPALYRRL